MRGVGTMCEVVDGFIGGSGAVGVGHGRRVRLTHPRRSFFSNASKTTTTTTTSLEFSILGSIVKTKARLLLLCRLCSL